MTRQIHLSVNSQPVELDYFVQGFIDHTVSAMVEALEGTGEIKGLMMSVQGEEVTINLNDSSVSVNPFVSRIIRNTIVGMVSSLKEVNAVNQIDISIEK
jgi:hypothetical protein